MTCQLPRQRQAGLDNLLEEPHPINEGAVGGLPCTTHVLSSYTPFARGFSSFWYWDLEVSSLPDRHGFEKPLQVMILCRGLHRDACESCREGSMRAVWSKPGVRGGSHSKKSEALIYPEMGPVF